MDNNNQIMIFDSVFAEIIKEAYNNIDCMDEIIAVSIDSFVPNIKNHEDELCQYLMGFYGISDVSINKKNVLLVMTRYLSLEEINAVYCKTYQIWEEKFCHEPFHGIWKQYMDFYNTILCLMKNTMLRQLRQDIPFFAHVSDNAVMMIYYHVFKRSLSSAFLIYDELYHTASMVQSFIGFFLKDNNMHIFQREDGRLD